jgi:catechol 2,3-dioxygenase-like lactoylglutathione lyase family enzyme
MTRLTRACPLFPAADVETSAAWYRDKLGFNVGNLYPDHGYAILLRDDIEIHLWKCNDPKVAEMTSAYIRPDDIDAVHASMQGAAEGGRISAPLDREWGMREFYVWDPDGNLLKFGVPVAVMAPLDHQRSDAVSLSTERVQRLETKVD